MISENGSMLSENKRFQRENQVITSIVDLSRINNERLKNVSFRDSIKLNYLKPLEISFNFKSLDFKNWDRYIDKLPFVPKDNETMEKRCEEILNIQTAGLAKRFEHTGLNKAVIGISGGLDSTLALLVIVKTFDLLGIKRENISAVTMPGFGTTDRTYNNAVNLCRLLNTDLKEINITDACMLHFKDIGHDPTKLDVTYENVQARERTQILMDLANKEGGLLIGTGDLSELAMGWCTYNGDHMSMYAVNTSVPKTLVRHLVRYAALKENDKKVSDILLDILDTPVSPELLPTDKNGEIKQKTEDIIGPYELHDFFLYYFTRWGYSKDKILFLAEKAFQDKYSDEELNKWMDHFIKRFFTQQFKRSCIPDGPKVGTVSLSQRGDWRMPSDASFNIWK
jgi:NAD+ synthase (glutamine-hydrolysing)